MKQSKAQKARHGTYFKGGMNYGHQQIYEKALDAINAAQNLALERHHQQLCKEHIAYALLNDEEGLIPKLVTKCGADAPQLVREIDRILSQMPSVTGSGASEVYLSQDCSLMLSQAEKTQRNRATIL